MLFSFYQGRGPLDQTVVPRYLLQLKLTRHHWLNGPYWHNRPPKASIRCTTPGWSVFNRKKSDRTTERHEPGLYRLCFAYLHRNTFQVRSGGYGQEWKHFFIHLISTNLTHSGNRFQSENKTNEMFNLKIFQGMFYNTIQTNCKEHTIQIHVSYTPRLLRANS